MRYVKRKFLNSYRILRFDLRGNVESALTLIPLLILTLTILQLATSSLNRRDVAAVLSGESTNFAINSDLNGQAQSLGDVGGQIPLQAKVEKIPLPTGANLILTEHQSNNPAISPLLIGGDNFSSSGMSIG
jgi:hypothetical protein